jgi:hypothetical protein
MNRRPMRFLIAAMLVAGPSAAFAVANSLAVDHTAALNGTSFGLHVTVNDHTASGVYVVSDEPNNESHFLVRFWLKPGPDLSLPQTANANYFRILNFRRVTGPNVDLVVFLKRSVSNGNYRINVWYRADSGAFANAGEFFLTLASGPVAQQIEIEYTKSDGSNNGQIIARKGGVVQFTKSGLVNAQMPVDEVFFGYIQNSGDAANVHGSFYLDEYESYR